MIVSPAFSGKRYAVLGLARSGLATVQALLASGAEVTAWDEKEEARRGLAEKSPGKGPAATLADPLGIDLAGYDGIIVSPGVPLNRHPIAAKAREAGVPVIGDIELFARARPSLPRHKVVGITGTNGKSTTTALLHHILRTAGVPSLMGGNIGLPILAQDPLPLGGVYVLELSSYQIDITFSLDCEVSVLLNVTPDHLDRYADFAAYRDSKRRLFDMQSPGHAALIGEDDPVAAEIADDLARGERSGDVRRFRRDALPERSDWPSLQGPHNAQNAAAAVMAAEMLGIPPDAVAQGLRTYSGLPHRMEMVGERNGIRFVNDSKATNPDSAAPALAAFPAIHWILGGLPKSDDLGPCTAHLDHVRAAYTIGEAGPTFARLLKSRVPVFECERLTEAVRRAAGAASPGEVVLLSPACASFDQFRDYEARGEAFRAAVEALA